jgi:hypothetical protein
MKEHNKMKKKLTKKEQKALNHAKLMASKKTGVPSTSGENTSIIEFPKSVETKKAA